MNKQIRFDYIDLAKGLGMLTIIWGHVHTGISTQLVYAFHIPLFFFLSGLVFSRQRYSSLDTFLYKRWKGLLFPYIVFSILTWFIWAVYSYVTHVNVQSFWMPLVQTFVAQGSEGYLVHNVPLWFVTCLFVVEVIYFFISKLSICKIFLISVAIGALGSWMSVTGIYDFSTLPWSIDVAFMALPFYALGSLINEHVGHEKITNLVIKNNGTTFFIMLGAAVILYYGGTYNGQVSMGHAYLGKNIMLFYPIALCGIFTFLCLCILFTSYKIPIIDKLIRLGILFGKRSFRAMVIHNPVKGFIIVLLARVYHSSTSVVQAGTLTSIVAFVLTLVITILVIKTIEYLLFRSLKRNSLLS